MEEQHTILGGKVYVYKRPNSSRWQCSNFFAGKNRRTSTREESLSKAKEVAEDWYLHLRGELLTGELTAEKTFREVSEQFLRECEMMTLGKRSKQYVKGQYLRRAFTWCPSSETWTSRRSPREKSWIIEFTDTNKQLRNAASRRHTAPCTTKS
jgi:hypothetical protein